MLDPNDSVRSHNNSINRSRVSLRGHGPEELAVFSERDYESHVSHVQTISSTKFQPKKVFEDNFIGEMHKILNKPKVDFPLYASTLQAGTKLFVIKAEQLCSSVDKFHSSLSLQEDCQEDRNEDGGTRKLVTKSKVNHSARCKIPIVADRGALKGCIDKVPMVEPLLSSFSTESNAKSLLLANLLFKPDGTLLIDSHASLKFEELPVPAEPSKTNFLFDNIDFSCSTSFTTFQDFNFGDRDERMAEIENENDHSHAEEFFVPNLDEPIDDAPMYEFNDFFHLSINPSNHDVGMDHDHDRMKAPKALDKLADNILVRRAVPTKKKKPKKKMSEKAFTFCPISNPFSFDIFKSIDSPQSVERERNASEWQDCRREIFGWHIPMDSLNMYSQDYLVDNLDFKDRLINPTSQPVDVQEDAHTSQDKLIEAEDFDYNLLNDVDRQASSMSPGSSYCGEIKYSVFNLKKEKTKIWKMIEKKIDSPELNQAGGGDDQLDLVQLHSQLNCSKVERGNGSRCLCVSLLHLAAEHDLALEPIGLGNFNVRKIGH